MDPQGEWDSDAVSKTPMDEVQFQQLEAVDVCYRGVTVSPATMCEEGLMKRHPQLQLKMRNTERELAQTLNGNSDEHGGTITHEFASIFCCWVAPAYLSF